MAVAVAEDFGHPIFGLADGVSGTDLFRTSGDNFSGDHQQILHWYHIHLEVFEKK